jgi:hypothetical protein
MKKLGIITGVSALSLFTYITEILASMGGGMPPGPGYWSFIQWLIEHGFM